ncbi:MAG: prolyl oligopeptidase family serine peptidase [Crocinitomix sp.]|nr:prolyl oligopeptidase family serine peptidase [Crocinitomix sp.]
MKITTLALLTLLSTLSYAQEPKKKIDHTAYADWNTISAILQSHTGQLVAYEINPPEGDGNLYIERIDGSNKHSFARGKTAQISKDETFVTFLIKPESDTIRSLKLDKVKEDKFPKDTLAIYRPATDSLELIANVKSYKLAKEGTWLAYLSQEDERPECSKKKCKHRKKKKCDIKSKTSGTTLHLINPTNGQTKNIDCVTDYKIDKKGKRLIYVTSLKGDTDTLSLHCLDTETMESKTLISNQLKIAQLSFDYENNQLAFLHSADTNKRKTFSLGYWNNTMEMASVLIDSNTAGMPENYTISEFCNPYFSRNGERLFIGTNNIVEQEAEDTLLATEKAKVDVWSGFDLRIQPQQLKQKKKDEKKNYRAVYHFDSKKLVQIADDNLERIRTVDHANGKVALAYTSKPYQKSMNWTFPWKNDVYLADLETGESSILKEGLAYTTSLSPSASYFIWYDGPDSNWYAKNVSTGEAQNLTASLGDLFASDINGNPYIPHSEGSSGWAKIDDVEYFIVNSRFDVWALCPSSPDLSFSITKGAGKIKNTTYRYRRFDRDSTYTTIHNGLIHSTDFDTKSEAYHSITLYFDPNLEHNIGDLEELISSNHRFTFLNKAKDSDQILFRRMNFLDYPELESATIDFKNPKTLTTTNPQQADYNWGTVEMIEWTSFEGLELRGLLYKPEDFDSTKSYPMIAYFYEEYSQTIHSHYVPKPTASIVYPTEYVSNGYIIFIPDIKYTEGHPAQSAYDCIVSGTDYLTQKYNWIDSTRMGLQGQSWGGYQTAQLITMTNKYKAAMAGAPVSNMFSAYGGIRWASGMSRMFQYERTQSRIGYTIWDKPDLYIENSPIFGLPNVQTPLLIMHNDGDGAVPWYQGIELYMGLRRLDQPVWLLNYNGDQHNLMKTANRKDLSIRMRQFFDYYLLDAEIPQWMDEGVPATDKGINYGLELKKD